MTRRRRTGSALPKKRAPKAGRYAYWTTSEDDIIRQYYPAEGRKACLARLPGRTIKGVRRRAMFLGVTVQPEVVTALRDKANKENAGSAAWSAGDDAIIRAVYPTGGANACVSLIPSRTRDSICQRARRLGVYVDREHFGQLVACGRLGTAPEVSREDLPAPPAAALDDVLRAWVSGRAVPRANSIAGTLYDFSLSNP